MLMSLRASLTDYTGSGPWLRLSECIDRNLLESVLLVLEQELYKPSLPLSLSLYENLGSRHSFSM
jgi:hypothetical protein